MAGGAFDVAQMICILRITNPSLRSMTWLRCTKCLRADHLPGAGIEKVQREGTSGPCKKPMKSAELSMTGSVSCSLGGKAWFLTFLSSPAGVVNARLGLNAAEHLRGRPICRRPSDHLRS